MLLAGNGLRASSVTVRHPECGVHQPLWVMACAGRARSLRNGRLMGTRRPVTPIPGSLASCRPGAELLVDPVDPPPLVWLPVWVSAVERSRLDP